MSDEALCNDVIQQVDATLKNDDRILVAYSGGIDSSVLLHALMTIRGKLRPALMLRAVYVHHGLSKHAGEWAEHCRLQCEKWNIPLQIAYVNVEPSLTGIEAAAREARYQALSYLLSDSDVLVTAQHRDDQCETFLLALKRGSGPAGLSAMPERMMFGDYQQVRPLLNVSRQQIEDYARIQKLRWVDDDSNQDARFDRNFLRLNILPTLEQRWPQFSRMVSRSAALCAEQERLLDELLAPTLSRLVDVNSAIDIDGLSSVSDSQRRALLRRWLSQQGMMMPSQDQLEKLWWEVALSQQDAEPQLRLGNYQIRRYQQRLYLLPIMQPVDEIQLVWDGKSTLRLPDSLGELTPDEPGEVVRSPGADEPVTVRFSAPGNLKIHIVGRTHSRSLKKLWQELDVPVWLRQRTPLLFYGDKLIAALGVFVTVEGQRQGDDAGWNIRYQKKSY
ncbi:tRNA lysidine(34) synthetase TilS [Jinshanibacter sp. LJY008]|uniref:tRNA(Ile)-lysidine synthase n=1 Tax=Limnobaculum eriocheiris TaxID=2897391 RepID=A0A9X1SJY1_9GAMM|nr:tRNA lysidine(34) synthetase TilS [Limnobaculum eriocheiris]MCD1125045.1 tRNA lysidine(34) synthetase TilS [Limnobaculum eriocheiris]